MIHCNSRKKGFSELEKIDPGPWGEHAGYCKLPAGWGTDHKRKGRCKKHGGNSRSGPAHPNWRHGEYAETVAAKLPPRIREVYIEALEDVELVAGRSDIAWLNTYLVALAEELAENESREGFRDIAIKAMAIMKAEDLAKAQKIAQGIIGVTSQRQHFHNTMDRIVRVTEQKRRLQQSERERLLQLEQMLRLKDLDGIIEFLVKTVHEALEKAPREIADQVLDHLAKHLKIQGDIQQRRALSA